MIEEGTIVYGATVAVNNTVVASPVTTKCKDTNWVLYQSKCYRVFNTFEYFTSANKICQDNGAKLASIRDLLENKVIEDIVRTGTRYNEAWIGLRLVPPASSYTWLDNAPMVYSNWLFERPNNDGKCVQIIPGGYWSNTLCYRKLQFVCKRAEVLPVQNNSKTKLIIMITLPLSCIVIMLLFISYLCFKSHGEIKSLRLEEKKISRHFIDVVTNSASVAPQKSTIEEAYEEQVKEHVDGLNAKEQAEDHQPRRKRVHSTQNGKERMYKQVTFV